MKQREVLPNNKEIPIPPLFPNKFAKPVGTSPC